MADSTPTARKVCTKCGAERDLDDFPRNASCSDGRRGKCRDCQAVGGHIVVTEKHCNTCGITKPVDAYQKRAAAPDGHNGQCRDCRSAERKAKYPAEREQILESNKARYRANREQRIAAQKVWKAANPDKVKRYARARYERNRERILEMDRLWYLENREVALGRARKWRLANPEVATARTQRRRARLADVTVGDVDLVALWDESGGICGLCSQTIETGLHYPDPLSKSVDHIVPLSKGGTHEQANLQWTHLVCNLRKGARPAA